MSTTLQNKEVGLTSEQAENSSKTLLNLMRDSDDLVIGSGMRHPIPEMAEAILKAAEEKKKEEESKHKSHLNALQQKISDLQNQLADLDNQIADKQRELERLRLEKLRGERQQQEIGEKLEQMRRGGQEDTPEYIALLAQFDDLGEHNEELGRQIGVGESELEELQNQRNDTANKLDTLENGTQEQKTEILNEVKMNELFESGVAQNDSLADATSDLDETVELEVFEALGASESFYSEDAESMDTWASLDGNKNNSISFASEVVEDNISSLTITPEYNAVASQTEATTLQIDEIAAPEIEPPSNVSKFDAFS